MICSQHFFQCFCPPLTFQQSTISRSRPRDRHVFPCLCGVSLQREISRAPPRPAAPLTKLYQQLAANRWKLSREPCCRACYIISSEATSVQRGRKEKLSDASTLKNIATMETLDHTPHADEERFLARKRKRQTILMLLGCSVLQFPIWGASSASIPPLLTPMLTRCARAQASP